VGDLLDSFLFQREVEQVGLWYKDGMPTYQYECEGCGHKLEKLQSIKAAPLKKCPECKKSKLKRLIGVGAGVIFKGAGFYCNDYKDK
jgi:putative FmdB family regulatory protein